MKREPEKHCMPVIVKWHIKQGLGTNSSLARTNFLRPVWKPLRSLLSNLQNIWRHVTRQDLNHSSHEKGMIKETKKVWHLLALLAWFIATVPINVFQILLSLPSRFFSNRFFKLPTALARSSRKNPNKGGWEHGISRGIEERPYGNSRGQVKKVEFPWVTRKNHVEFSWILVFGLEISKSCSTILWNFQGWSFLFSGISKSKVINLKIPGFFSKSCIFKPPVWIFSGIARCYLIPQSQKNCLVCVSAVLACPRSE